MKIFLISENSREPQEVEVGAQSSTKEVISAVNQVSNNTGGEGQRHYFVEDRDEDNGQLPEGWKFKDKDRIHCHRCEHVDVAFSYNGMHKRASYSPGTTGGKILLGLPKLFPGMTPRDAANLKLEISANVYIDKNDHLGSFVEYPHCHIEVALVSKTNVQG